MQYQIPPDVLHYEPRLLLGLTAQEIMMIGMGTLVGIQQVGLIGGLLAGLAVFLAAVRFPRFGNLSLLIYFFRSLWHRYRPQTIIMPRVLPEGGEIELTLYDWDGQEQMRLGGWA
ncbi:MAG: hypothetical protein N2117_12830 [Anaerolineales bacterium]|nr:hypothetical protein [Anaerolineales bacterium]